MNVVIKGDESLVKMIQEYYHDEINPDNNPNSHFMIKNKDYTIIAYKTNTIMFQGKEGNIEADKWQTFIQVEKEKVTKPKPVQPFVPQHAYTECIGSDEVGTGAYFGPVVVCSAYVDNDIINKIDAYLIKDSKKITDETIRAIAPHLMENVPHVIYSLNNIKYNEAIKTNNLNEIKAKMHNYCLIQLVKHLGKVPPIVVDQFTPPNKYFEYLKNEKNVIKDIHFQTKAEDSYLCVAVASIIARYQYLVDMDNLSKDLKVNLKHGASASVDLQAITLVKKHGFEVLNKIAKVHFANTKKIKDKLKQ